MALALLVTLYAVSVTWESPDSELLHGVGLLVCIAAFLWLGRLPASRAVAAAAAIAVAGTAALPAAARIDSTEPLIKYGGWKIFGDEEVASFDWDHSYGPLDWPQNGTELFAVEGAERPFYWKTDVLANFDGFAWSRGEGIIGTAAETARNADLAGATTAMVADHGRWVEGFEVTMRGLRSRELVTTGTTLAAEDVPVLPTDPDGTTAVLGEPLTQGTSYRITAYTPDPSAQLLRRRDDLRYPPALQRYTSLWLPGADPTGLPATVEPARPLVGVTVPLRAEPGRDSNVITYGGELPASGPYARVEALAERITRDTPGSYRAVAAIERYLLENYEYDQDVADRDDPLPAFLLRDKRGYCQHFSGAMALMLRLIGIPSRVVSGFAPGVHDPDTGTYVVRDTDAHSWVEVWFPEVGWVTVDPTPSAAPARTETAQTGGVTGADVLARSNRAFAIDEGPQSGSLRGGEAGGSGNGNDVAEPLLDGGAAGSDRARLRVLSPPPAPALALRRGRAAAGGRAGDDAGQARSGAGDHAARHRAGVRARDRPGRLVVRIGPSSQPVRARQSPPPGSSRAARPSPRTR